STDNGREIDGRKMQFHRRGAKEAEKTIEEILFELLEFRRLGCNERKDLLPVLLKETAPGPQNDLRQSLPTPKDISWPRHVKTSSDRRLPGGAIFLFCL